jgi:hypothetical membrane protein
VTNQKQVLQKIGAACGFAVPPVAFGAIAAAILSWNKFSWTNNALSDLGVVPGVTAPIFNMGLLSAGVLGVLFSVLGLFNYFRDTRLGRAGALAFAVSTFALMLIGIFNESFRPTHYIVSVMFFAALPLALLVITATLYRKHQTKLAVFTLAASLVAAAPWILLFSVHYVPDVAIPETISGLTGCVWIIIISYQVLKTAKP